MRTDCRSQTIYEIVVDQECVLVKKGVTQYSQVKSR